MDQDIQQNDQHDDQDDANHDANAVAGSSHAPDNQNQDIIQNVDHHVDHNVDKQPSQQVQGQVILDQSSAENLITDGATNQQFRNSYGQRTQRRAQSLVNPHDRPDPVQPGRRTQRRARSHYNKNVRIKRGEELPNNTNRIIRRSGRISKTVQRYNIGEIVCFICKKKYRADISIDHYDGNIACSLKCFKMA